MKLFKFSQSDGSDAYHLFKTEEDLVSYLRDNYDNVTVYKEQGLQTPLITLEMDGIVIWGRIIEPVKHF